MCMPMSKNRTVIPLPAEALIQGEFESFGCPGYQRPYRWRHYNFRYASNRCGDHGQAARHCFKDYVWPTFTRTGEAEQIRCAVPTRELLVWLRSCQHHVIAHAQ